MENVPTSLWELALFGTLEFRAPDHTLYKLTSRKATELVAFLALARNPSVSRDVVSEALWPDVDQLTARNRLKATLSNLKQEIPGLPILTHGKQYLELSRAQVTVDYDITERQLKWRRALGLRERQALTKRLLDRIQPRLLPEIDAPWVLAERWRYDELAKTLAQDLRDAPPTENIIRLGDEFGGLLIPLIGRDQELEQVKAWLAAKKRRELHIVGTPGVGKTRLLREALGLVEESTDVLISLSTVQNSETSWLERLGRAIEVREPDRISETLSQFLSDFKSPLFVIDDIDQGGAPMLEWLVGIMQRVPHARLLATARRHPIDPLVEICALRPLMTNEQDSATTLLVAFASHFGAGNWLGFSLPSLTSLATYLEGLPLALEIAGAWLPLIRPEALLKRLETSPDLLMQPSAVGRGSLAALMTSVFEQLDKPEQEALLCLSICRGGCGEKLAEELLGEHWLWRVRALLERSLIIRLDGLVENRFLVVQALREAVITVAGEERANKAKSDWREACLRQTEEAGFEINERDRQYYMNWLRDEGDNVLAACRDSKDQRGNLARAINALQELISPFWLIGRSQSSRSVLNELLVAGEQTFTDTLAPDTPTTLVVRLVKQLQAEGRRDEALNLIFSHRKSIEQTQNRKRLAEALDRESDTRFELQDLDGAMACWLDCSSVRTEMGYRRHALWLEAKLNAVDLAYGRFALADQRRYRAMATAKEIEDYNSLGMYLKHFAGMALEERNFAEAERLSTEALEAFRQSGESITLFDALIVRSSVSLAQNAFDKAQAYLNEAETLVPADDPIRLERLAILLEHAANRSNKQLFYDHLTIEH